jgi:tRNA A64-2'-O-ribosylphosphate transferase
MTRKGLTPQIFWTHRHQLLKAYRSDLLDVVSSLVRSYVQSGSVNEQCSFPSPIAKVGGRIMICSISDLSRCSPHLAADAQGTEPALLVIADKSNDPSKSLPPHASGYPSSSIICLETPAGKKGQLHFMQSVLPQSMSFIRCHLAKGSTVCIACSSGNDLSVGVALSAIQLFFDEDGVLQDMQAPPRKLSINYRASDMT